MKIIISYPPFSSIKGTPLISQNRQYQVFSEKTVIYPLVPACSATLLKQVGHEVIWLDCIAEGWDYEKFLKFIEQEKPDLIAFETKTPVIKQHWKIINRIKDSGLRIKIVLFGDHVTALPEESFKNSKVDYILTGGDYDFLLLNLANWLSVNQTPVIPAQAGIQKDKEMDARFPPSGTSRGHDKIQLEPGIWYRENGEIKNTGKFQLNHDLSSLPLIDRDLTKWWLYAYKNGNYKRTPGTYIMSGRDCWHHQCTFCSWVQMYTEFRTRKVDNVLDEIGQLIEKYNIREIMDDTGTFPVGNWLKDFCAGMIKRGYNKKVYLDCNMRFGCLSKEVFGLMKKANFRLLLFGLESSNQKTLDRLKKNLNTDDIIKDCKAARKAGLYPHITIMFGYPWETYEDAKNTLELGSYLLKKGYAYTVQATIVIPYPGSPLFDECKSNGWLNTEDWDRYDMKEPVMKVPMGDKELSGLVQEIYKVSLNPEFLLNKIVSIKDFEDLRYFGRAGRKVIGHILDFKGKK